MTDRTLGIWTDWDHGVTTDMKKYKLDMYVRGVPLYCNYLPHNPTVTGFTNHGWSPDDFSQDFVVQRLFNELKEFILENPEYAGILLTEFEGYGHIDDYFNFTIKIKDITNVFNDMETIANFRTNWNNIRMLWYLKNIHENIKPVWEFDNIIDFGAGTGHFIKHCYQIGFKGEAQIVDIPQTVPIQKHVLRGLNVKWVEAKQLLTNLPNTLFNSTWGFSETPLVVRDELPDISNCSKFIAFQHNFEGIDNKKDILERFRGKEPPILRNISILAPWDGGSTMLMSKSFI